MVLINRKGKVIHAKVVESLLDSCDDAVLDVIQSMLDWYPRIRDGSPVVQTAIIPVVFRLQ